MDCISKCRTQNIEEKVDNFGCDCDFLDIRPKAQSMKNIIDKLDFTRIANICPMEDETRE